MDDMPIKRKRGGQPLDPDKKRVDLRTKIAVDTLAELERRKEATGKALGVLIDEAIKQTIADH